MKLALKLTLVCLSLVSANPHLQCHKSSGVAKNTSARPITKDACCPAEASGTPYNTQIKGCCCGKMFTLADDECCLPTDSCDGTELIITKGSTCEKLTCKGQPEGLGNGETFDCTGNKKGDTCTLDSCGEDFVLVDNDNISETQVTATCDNSFNWVTNIPANLCCVPKCPPLPPATKIDFIIVIDKSSSIGNEDFEIVRDFLLRLVDVLPVGTADGQGRLSMLTYNAIVEPVITFEDSATKTKDQMKEQIESIVYAGKGTLTYQALQHVIDNDMSDSNSFNRADAEDVLLVVTDGESRNNKVLPELSEELETKGAEIFAIGVGDANESELEAMASDPIENHMKMVVGFDELEGIADKFLVNFCEETTC